MAPFKKQKQKPKQLSRDTKSQIESQSGKHSTILHPANTVQSVIPLELQQAVLATFANALRLADVVDLASTVQQVKGHLFNRDFLSAFSNPDNLAAYAYRWSAGRALAYANIFTSSDLTPCWTTYAKPLGQMIEGEEQPQNPRVVCIGGGAGAELVALAAATRHLPLPSLYLQAVDIADWWAPVLSKLEIAIGEPPPLPPSAFAKTAPKPIIEADQLKLQFDQHDVLGYTADQLQSMLGNVTLVTIMFTLNELFTNSIAKTTALLLGLTDTMQPGSWLLVVDSPGSYSEVALGQGLPKKYPMQWLLDHTLLQLAGNSPDGTKKWRKQLTDESRWFRINAELKYPVELENMRYQIHLFQRAE